MFFIFKIPRFFYTLKIIPKWESYTKIIIHNSILFLAREKEDFSGYRESRRGKIGMNEITGEFREMWREVNDHREFYQNLG